MAEYVGFITNIKPEWMDLAFNCKINGMSKAEAKPLIENAAAEVYSAKENITKTRRVLETIFFDNDSWILLDSLDIYRSLTEKQRLPLYWALLISNFPVFFDTCRSIGDFAEYRNTVTLMQVRQPVYSIWGSRNIIHQAVKKVFQTLKDFDVLSNAGRPGTFNIHSYSVRDSRLVNYLAVAVLQASQSSYLTWESIITHRVLFPFSIEYVTQADIAACENLCLDRMGDDVVIRVYAHSECR